jgi:hypothetical protein
MFFTGNRMKVEFLTRGRRETAKLLQFWSDLPKRWKAKIGRSLSQAMDIVPLEKGIIQRLKDLLV